MASGRSAPPVGSPEPAVTPGGGFDAASLRERFVRDVLANRNNRAILDRWQTLGLHDGWLVAGCLFQTVWNVQQGWPAEGRIKDYDLFYFDGADLSAEGERRMQSQVDEQMRDLSISIEVANQARVHLWYPGYFGVPYPQLRSAREGIDRFLVRGTCVGIRPSGDGLEIYAPYGLGDLYEGLLAPNALRDCPALFKEKADSYRARWPWLTVR